MLAQQPLIPKMQQFKVSHSTDCTQQKTNTREQDTKSQYKHNSINSLYFISLNVLRKTSKSLQVYASQDISAPSQEDGNPQNRDLQKECNYRASKMRSAPLMANSPPSSMLATFTTKSSTNKE